MQKGGHTTLRVYFSDADDVAPTRRQLKKLGCSTEVSNLPKLVAVDVPPDAGYAEVRRCFEHSRGSACWNMKTLASSMRARKDDRHVSYRWTWREP